jgi:hypothetical protein
MGDLAANIAERAICLESHDPLQTVLNFNRMASGVEERVLILESDTSWILRNQTSKN